MNILLVYPQYPDTFWSFKHVLKFIRKKAAFPPLGLLTVAGLLPHSWCKRLVDLNVAVLTDNDIDWADMIMVSAMMVQKHSADEIISRVISLGKTVVAGGSLFTAQPEKYPQVHHLVLGEAEVTLPLFLSDWASGRPQHIYNSLARPDISQTPLPQWQLIKFRNYATMLVQFSRGCPFDCEYCDIVYLNGRHPRTKLPAQMMAELQVLYDAGWRSTVFIVDDNFIGNKIKAKEFLRQLIDWQKQHHYPFKFLTEASVNLAADDELLNLMSVANFGEIFLGLETPCLDSLKECGKHINAKTDLTAAVKKIHSYGIAVMGGFIVGFDSDDIDIFDRQFSFIQEIGVAVAMVGVLTALPGTRLWHRLRDEERLIEDSTGGNTDGTVNFFPTMGRDNLRRGYQKLLHNLYIPRYYYQRIHNLLKNYRPTVKQRFSWPSLWALLVSLCRIGLISRQRFFYWWLLGKTILTKMKAFPLAVTLAIYGLHFQKVAQAVAVGKKNKIN